MAVCIVISILCRVRCVSNVVYRVEECHTNHHHSPVARLMQCSFLGLVAGELEVHQQLEEEETSLQQCKWVNAQHIETITTLWHDYSLCPVVSGCVLQYSSDVMSWYFTETDTQSCTHYSLCLAGFFLELLRFGVVYASFLKRNLWQQLEMVLFQADCLSSQDIKFDVEDHSLF